MTTSISRSSRSSVRAAGEDDPEGADPLFAGAGLVVEHGAPAVVGPDQHRSGLGDQAGHVERHAGGPATLRGGVADAVPAHLVTAGGGEFLRRLALADVGERDGGPGGFGVGREERGRELAVATIHGAEGAAPGLQLVKGPVAGGHQGLGGTLGAGAVDHAGDGGGTVGLGTRAGGWGGLGGKNAQHARWGAGADVEAGGGVGWGWGEQKR